MFKNGEQQQDAPAGQEADVLQQEDQPGSLVVDVNQGWQLEGDKTTVLRTNLLIMHLF